MVSIFRSSWGLVEMRGRFGGVVWVCLGAGLAGSAHGQTSPAIGVVLSTRNGQVGSVPATPGVSVFSGDRLSTPKDSGLIVQAGKFQFWFHDNTNGTLTARPQGVALELESGSATFSSVDGGQSLEIFVSDIRIEPHSAQGLEGHITIQSPCGIIVTSKQGSLRIMRRKEIRKVLEGTSVQVTPGDPIEPRPRGIALEDQSFHRSHAHGKCTPPAAKGRVMDWVYPVVFMETAAVVSVLLLEDVSPSRIRP